MLAPGTKSSMTVAPGGTASYSIVVSPEGGFQQTVTGNMFCYSRVDFSEWEPMGIRYGNGNNHRISGGTGKSENR